MVSAKSDFRESGAKRPADEASGDQALLPGSVEAGPGTRRAQAEWMVAKVVVAVAFAYVAFSCYSEIVLVALSRAARDSGIDAPVIYDGIPFKNGAQMKYYAAEARRLQLHGWTAPLDEWLVQLLLGGAVGALGGTVRYIRDGIASGRWNARTHELLGFATGITLLSVLALIPDGNGLGTAQALTAFSFLGGIFSEDAWSFVRRVSAKVFALEGRA